MEVTDRLFFHQQRRFAVCKEFFHHQRQLAPERPQTYLSRNISDKVISSSFLLKRAKKLTYEFNPHGTTITRHLGSYDEDQFNTYLNENQNMIKEDLLHELRQCNIDRAFVKLDSHIHEAHKASKVKPQKTLTYLRFK